MNNRDVFSEIVEGLHAIAAERKGKLTLRHVSVWAETASTGLWNDQGHMVLPEDLGLQSATVARLAAWCSWFEDFEGHLPTAKRTQPLFPLDAFNAAGQAIAASIQDELPGWTVTYRVEPLEWSSKPGTFALG